MTNGKLKPIFKIYYVPTGYGLAKDADILRNTIHSLGFQCHIEKSTEAHAKPSKTYNYFFYILKRYNFLGLFKKLARIFNKRSNVYSLHLENIIFKKCFLNENHILIPNQEWFDPHSVDLLRFIDDVWCKSHIAESIFKQLNCKTQYIGFCSSIDVRLKNINKSREYIFSRVGKSKYRGGDLLIALWEKHPEWPQLKIVGDPKQIPHKIPENVEYIASFSEQNDFQILAASSLFHIYMTETEGFGHSIYEAMGYGSVVALTNAPPMNEIVNDNCAILVEANYIGQKLLAPRFGASKQAVEAAVMKFLTLTDDDINRLSINAHLHYQELEEVFIKNMRNVINRL